MLYLVKLDSAYKIGYSKNPSQRIKQFESTHIEIKLISTKFGNKDDEKQLHLLCNDYHIKNELFKQDNNVIKIFNTYISENLMMEVNSLTKTISLQKEIIKNQDNIITILQEING